MDLRSRERDKKVVPLSETQHQWGWVAVIFVISILFWNTFLLYPVKLFVVALHEMSHGVAAILSGGEIVNIQIDPKIGGYCRYRIPASSGVLLRIFISSAGYLGSMFWGALIFFLSSRKQYDRRISAVIGVFMGILTFLVIKTGDLFGIIFCMAFTLFIFFSVKWFSDLFHDLFLKFLGLSSCLYVITDIKSDLIDRTGIGSDADRIAQLIGIKGLSIPIGIFWIVLAIGVLVVTLKYSVKKERA